MINLFGTTRNAANLVPMIGFNVRMRVLKGLPMFPSGFFFVRENARSRILPVREEAADLLSLSGVTFRQGDSSVVSSSLGVRCQLTRASRQQSGSWGYPLLWARDLVVAVR